MQKWVGAAGAFLHWRCPASSLHAVTVATRNCDERLCSLKGNSQHCFDAHNEDGDMAVACLQKAGMSMRASRVAE